MSDPAYRPAPLRRFVLIGAALSGAVLFGTAACTLAPVDSPPASVVFFTAFSADLDDGAKGVIADAAETARASPTVRVVVQGYADAIGTPTSNMTLSLLRAQVVADGLVAKGVDRARITLRPRGSAQSDPGIESRRVDITFAR